MVEGNVNFMPSVMPESIMHLILKDNTPTEISRTFWDFGGVGLDTALLEDYEIKRLPERIRINVFNILSEHPEWEWNEIFINEYIPTEPGKPPIIKKHKLYPNLQDMLINKTKLVKGSRGKHGNLLEKLTTASSRALSENIIQQMPTTIEEQQNKSGWSGLLSGWRK